MDNFGKCYKFSDKFAETCTVDGGGIVPWPIMRAYAVQRVETAHGEKITPEPAVCMQCGNVTFFLNETDINCLNDMFEKAEYMCAGVPDEVA